MALLRTKDIREMNSEQRIAKLKELRTELMHERGVTAMGGAPHSPGQLGALRKNVARLLTIMHEDKLKARGGKR